MIEQLRRWLPPGEERIYLVKRRNSRTGTTTVVGVFLVESDRRIKPISREVASVIGWDYDQLADGVVMRGNDAWRLMVAKLSRALYINGGHLQAEWL